MCNVTYKLLVIGKDLMPFTIVQCHSQAIGHRKRFMPFTNVQCHSQTVGNMKRCDGIAFHKMCNVTHSLLVIGRDVMKLPFMKCVNVTHSLLVIVKDLMRLTSTEIFGVAHILSANTLS